MSHAKTYVDSEGSLRAYLRGLSAITSLVGQRVFFGPPDAGTTYPFITMARTGGGPQANLTPVDDVEISFSVWGETKQEAGDVSAALVSAIESIQPGTILEAGLKCGGASVLLWLWSPDSSTDKPTPRYIVDCVLSVIAVS